MIPLTTRSSEHIAVFGLGTSGRSAAHALTAGGARVTAWDDNEEARNLAAAEGIALDDIATSDWSRFSALVLGPGVPLTHPAPHPVVTLARQAGIDIIGDIELLCEACSDATLIGVTGTNGKSTTTAMIDHVLGHAGRQSQVGGNLGPPALGLAPPHPDDLIVLELSSYQLDLTQKAGFDVAVLLNLTPDHLDRHGDMDGYIAAKRHIFRISSQQRKPLAVVGVDDAPSRAVFSDLAAAGAWHVCAVSGTQRIRNGVYVSDGQLVDTRDGTGCDLGNAPALGGPHNWQNAAAAWSVARRLGVSAATIEAAFASYSGLPHRMETVSTRRGIVYINDSKATNGDATACALASHRDIYWICGGVAKEDGLRPTLPWLDNVRHAFLIGQAALPFAEFLHGRVPTTNCGHLEMALKAASQRAQNEGHPRPVVLLSPACASFDQYQDFGARGEHFRELVAALDLETVR